MYILTICGNSSDGAFAVSNEYGEKVLLMFVNEDDAARYLMMLEELGYSDIEVTEVNPQSAILTCEHFNYQYAIITPNELIVPPNYDFISKTKV
jgi:hypothetical protein